MRVLVTGGYFDGPGEGFVDRVDLARGTRERLLAFVPPEPHRVSAKGFTGAAWLDGGTLLVCGFDAVWRFEPSTGRCTGRLHQADFNDLHGLVVDEATQALHVCNTGLDAVETFTLDGRFLGRSAMSPGWFEAARQHGAAVARDDFGRACVAGWAPLPALPLTTTDGPYYQRDGPFHRRKVRDYLHPNHVVVWGGDVVATLLASRELRSMRTHRTLARLDAPPHDGLVIGDTLWVTTVDGRVWSVTHGGVVSLVTDTSATGRLGWCRGLMVEGGTLAVGLTAIRTSPQYAWRSDAFTETATEVLWIEHATGRLLGAVRYDEPGRHAKVFALLPGQGTWA